MEEDEDEPEINLCDLSVYEGQSQRYGNHNL
jgi:hypothetical protein